MNFELDTSCKLAPAGGERELAEKKPGEDNHESWAGTKKGEPLSPEAQKAYDEMLKSKNKRKKDCKK